MIAFITAAWTTVKGSQFAKYAVAVLVVVGGVLLAVARIFSAGKAAEKAKQQERTIETQRRIQDADARGPRTAHDVDERLRRGDF